MEDAESLAMALNNKKIHDNLRDGLPFPYTVKDAGEYITEMRKADKDPTYAFAITMSDKAVGIRNWEKGSSPQPLLCKVISKRKHYLYTEHGWG